MQREVNSIVRKTSEQMKIYMLFFLECEFIPSCILLSLSPFYTLQIYIIFQDFVCALTGHGNDASFVLLMQSVAY